MVVCVCVLVDRYKCVKVRVCVELLRESTPSSVYQTFLMTLFESAERCRFTDIADVMLPHLCHMKTVNIIIEILCLVYI